MKLKHVGFTLIELLVVIIIIAVATTFVMLSIGNHDQQRRIQNLAEQLTQVIPVAQQTAVLQSTVLGLQLTQQRYQWVRYHVAANNQTGSWQVITDNAVLNPHSLPSDIHLQIQVLQEQTRLDKNVSSKPQLLINPSGEFAPFIIIIRSHDGKIIYRVIGSVNGDIKINSNK